MAGFSKAFGITTGILVAIAVVTIGSGMMCTMCVVGNWPDPVAAANANENAAPQIETIRPRQRAAP